MLDINVKHAHVTCHMEGCLLDLLAETCVAVHSIYEGVQESSPEAAKVFADRFGELVKDGDLWKSEKEIADQLKAKAEPKEEKKPDSDDCVDPLKSLLTQLADLLK